MTTTVAHKLPLDRFLARNPFPEPMTDGLFYRDKMRALHRIAPDVPVGNILEIGGGQSGLSAMLYPQAEVVNLDMDASLGEAPCNKDPRVTFVHGDATALPFPDASFDMVTMFDLLEHVPDDAAVAREALRVVRPGGWILVSTPDRERWRYPYYGIFRPICPPEEDLFAEWGHVRRGYTRAELAALFGKPADKVCAFINPLLALSHDVSFSRLSRRGRRMLHALLAPASVLGWVSHRMSTPGTEIAAAWQRP
ncbi:class I SAM-dependent methyltransferase [uncultured Paracoccus sp.]|uniref:class I SAM-dependent methyltransferase n=1 Tax=uncultured Paracoccus sp. TaxID=189685 RepID=UPI00263369DC|nr:class I SAM-dependent methyltransferase [uncultured Paracoccus sp.]